MITAARSYRAVRPAPRGTTLLEVLVACGLLVVGLASVAALLPAAGARLGQAATEDRAGTLAANARSEALARGLVAFDLFADANKSLAFGKGMTTLPAISAAQFAAPDAATLNQRIDPQRGFLLEDELMFSPPTTAETPVNEFVGGRREFKEGVCWGATLVPQTVPAAAGSAAVLGIAVFRKDPTPQAIPLTQVSGGLYRMTTPDVTPLPASPTPTPAEVQAYELSMAPYEADMKRFLKNCSSVLVATAGGGPRWFRITASWRPLPDPLGVRLNDGCYVVFADAGFAGHAGATPTVIGFDTLIRVDQYNVTLE